MRTLSILLLLALAGCGSFQGKAPFGGGAGTSKTFDAPISRVKPAFVSTLAQMGMQITSVETRGKTEIIKAKKSGSSVELEMERAGGTATRVRVDATGASTTGQILRQAEKNLASG